jgi:hypothetical protein
LTSGKLLNLIAEQQTATQTKKIARTNKSIFCTFNQNQGTTKSHVTLLPAKCALSLGEGPDRMQVSRPTPQRNRSKVRLIA